MKLAFLYAGQGAQHVGMGRDLYEKHPLFRHVFDSAPVDFDLKKLCFEGPVEQLNDTRFTQPCLVAFAAGVTALLYEAGVHPAMAAGLSLGEYSALHAAGVFDVSTAIELVAFRGRVMAEAVTNRPCAMAAVLHLERGKLQAVCAAASHRGVVEIANYNCPGQLVIAGDAAGVEQASLLAKEAGARRVIPLNVSGPFHTSLMAPAGKALEKRFRTLAFGPMAFPVLFNCTGNVMGTEDSIPHLLERQVQQSVYLEDTIRNMAAQGVDTIVEIGPGQALSGFVRKTVKGITTYPVETAQELERTLCALKGASQ